MPDTWSKQSHRSKPLTRDDSVSSVMDDIGIGQDDESFSVVIVGGGPHALAALSALYEDSQHDETIGTGPRCSTLSNDYPPCAAMPLLCHLPAMLCHALPCSATTLGAPDVLS